MKKTADILWQNLIGYIWRGRCAKCGATYMCSGHHIIKRRYLHTRWSVMNGILLCATCHRMAEENKTEFLEWLKDKWPIMHNWHEENKNPPPHTFPQWELRETCQELRALVKRLSKWAI